MEDCLMRAYRKDSLLLRALERTLFCVINRDLRKLDKFYRAKGELDLRDTCMFYSVKRSSCEYRHFREQDANKREKLMKKALAADKKLEELKVLYLQQQNN
jgi:hypothetical protein